MKHLSRARLRIFSLPVYAGLRHFVFTSATREFGVFVAREARNSSGTRRRGREREKSKRYGATRRINIAKSLFQRVFGAHVSTRSSTHTYTHTNACLLSCAENHAQLSVVKSPAARGEKGALEKGSLGANTPRREAALHRVHASSGVTLPHRWPHLAKYLCILSRARARVSFF